MAIGTRGLGLRGCSARKRELWTKARNMRHAAAADRCWCHIGFPRSFHTTLPPSCGPLSTHLWRNSSLNRRPQTHRKKLQFCRTATRPIRLAPLKSVAPHNLSVQISLFLSHSASHTDHPPPSAVRSHHTLRHIHPHAVTHISHISEHKHNTFVIYIKYIRVNNLTSLQILYAVCECVCVCSV